MTLPYNKRDFDGEGLGISTARAKDAIVTALVGLLNGGSGTTTIPLGAATVDVQLDAALDGKPVFANLMFADATLLHVQSVVWDGNGKITITGNANATADTLVSYFVDAR